MDKKYKYVGNGLGVAGLPHEISDEEAKALGSDVAALLKEAVRNGTYVFVDDHAVLEKTKEKEHGK